jgi:thiamine pyrophosphate-dependent acetolactate synthase large subunit-like protein
MAQRRTAKKALLHRRDVVGQILKNRGKALVVTGIGNAVHDVCAAGDDAGNMYLGGIMGGASMVAFGIAVAQPDRRVLVITGDGELLAGIGSLPTIGAEKPGNLSIIVIDNEAYGATGNQQTHTAQGVDLAGIAAASGFPHTIQINNSQELEAAIPDMYEKPGPYFAVIKVAAKSGPRVNAPKDGTYIARRFRAACTGEGA